MDLPFSLINTHRSLKEDFGTKNEEDLTYDYQVDGELLKQMPWKDSSLITKAALIGDCKKCLTLSFSVKEKEDKIFDLQEIAKKYEAQNQLLILEKTDLIEYICFLEKALNPLSGTPKKEKKNLSLIHEESNESY